MTAPAQRGIYIGPGEGRAIWSAGDTYTIKSTAESSGGSLSFFEARVPPQGGPPPHYHQLSDEAFYILEEEIEVEFIGDRKVIAGPGAFIFFPKGVPHRFQNVGSRPAKLLFLFTPGGPERFFEAVGQPAGEGDAPPLSQAEIEKALVVGPEYDTYLLPPPQP